MRRFFEFSDQPWLPRLFRDLLTELLEHQLERYRVYSAAVPKLNDALRRTGSAGILDLCSGSGGPLLHLLPHLEARRLTLSDRYPNQRRLEALNRIPRVSYLPYSVDACAVPPALTDCRTMFTSFHHFDVPDAKQILRNAVEARAPICVFEFTYRASAGLWTALRAAWSVLRDTRGVRPRGWARLFWTYLVPVMPLLYAWDAVVSHRRTYGPDELAVMTAELPGYDWEAGILPLAPPPDRITYLIGTPAA